MFFERLWVFWIVPTVLTCLLYIASVAAIRRVMEFRHLKIAAKCQARREAIEEEYKKKQEESHKIYWEHFEKNGKKLILLNTYFTPEYSGGVFCCDLFFVRSAIIDRASTKKAGMSAFGLNNGARYLNLYEPLCGVVEYVIVNPTWRPDFDLVESKLNPELQDFVY